MCAGGLIMIDNLFWGGDGADLKTKGANTSALRALNDRVLADTCVELVLVPIGDGMTLAHKV